MKISNIFRCDWHNWVNWQMKLFAQLRQLSRFQSNWKHREQTLLVLNVFALFTLGFRKPGEQHQCAFKRYNLCAILSTNPNCEWTLWQLAQQNLDSVTTFHTHKKQTNEQFFLRFTHAHTQQKNKKKKPKTKNKTLHRPFGPNEEYWFLGWLGPSYISYWALTDINGNIVHYPEIWYNVGSTTQAGGGCVSADKTTILYPVSR